jgi:hypothetical protein
MVAVLMRSVGFTAYAMELHRMALWQVVRASVADYTPRHGPGLDSRRGSPRPGSIDYVAL